MSAFICQADANRIDLLTDGAVYTSDGVLAAICLKAIQLPKCNAAFTTRGCSVILFELAETFSRISGFDNLIAATEEILPKVREHWRSLGATEWELFITGFSEAGPEMYLYQADNAQARQRLLLYRRPRCAARRHRLLHIPARHSNNGGNAPRRS